MISETRIDGAGRIGIPAGYCELEKRSGAFIQSPAPVPACRPHGLGGRSYEAFSRALKPCKQARLSGPRLARVQPVSERNRASIVSTDIGSETGTGVLNCAQIYKEVTDIFPYQMNVCGAMAAK